MIAYLKKILASQFEASLSMMNECVQKCPEGHWNGKIAKYAFWHVAYHALCFADLYLSPDEDTFQPRDFHPHGRSEFYNEFPSRHFDKGEITEYLGMCRQKAIETLASETRKSLERKSGFPWLSFSRGESHLYNIRHIQHHTGQVSAYLRRIDETLQDPKAHRWVRTGWR